ncbi:MAG: hypothetical protein M1832_000281 [Thelocarpon impressellum]|nr:MAG: hypothetical protein M1832_000281 [Thelocarpon impressellum]
MAGSRDVDPDLLGDSPLWTPPRNGRAGANENGYSREHVPGGASSPFSSGLNDLQPGQPLSLSGIAMRAFALGNACGSAALLTATALFWGSPLWRASFFVAALALFHLLEFWTTARYNTRLASVSSFLLSSNGAAYNVAHSAALAECVVRNVFFEGAWLSAGSQTLLTAVGILLIVVGQTTRSLAMAQAGPNFNHTVQTKRRDEHRLVTHGIYAVLRHPSYFGFFWWGLGTQLVLGNAVCFVAYAVVLWKFFSQRIGREEGFLVAFFGREYEEYRGRTWTMIPFIP